MSDLTTDACARITDKNLTITSAGTKKATISRTKDTFKRISDNNQSWYNPAMIEVLTRYGTDATNAASLTLRNIILDDQGHHRAKDQSS